MALYAIGDLHLAFQAELKNKEQQTGALWKDREKKLKKNCDALIQDDDTLVLLGDHSWGRKLAECEKDFEYIESLPGRKILLRGNHDMFWEAKKTEKLNQLFAGKLSFLQNCFYTYQDYALVGTKGFTFEGPFYVSRDGRRLIGWDEEAKAHADRLVERECVRLRDSFEKAKAAGYRKYIMFLHYPPTSILEKDSPFTRMAEEYGAEKVIYAHCHGEARFHDSIRGTYHGIEYSLASGDCLRWHPMKVLD